MKFIKITTSVLVALLIAGGTMLTSCGSGENTNSDSTAVDTAVSIPEGSGSLRDTAPAAEMPPGSVNPGEDSARYGTGTDDSSKNRRP